MPLASIPAINANVCSGWTEQDVNLYNKLPFYLAKMQVERRKTWVTWAKFLGKKRWTPNMGPIMRSVTKEPSPHVRQTANPALINLPAKKDVMQIRERSVDEQVRHHKFESLNLNFLPDFRDFMKDHVKATGTDIMEKMERYEDLFYRSNIIQRSPFIWVPGRAAGELVTTPTDLWDETYANTVTTLTGANSKNSAFWQAMFAQIGQEGTLGFETLNRLTTVAENDIGMPNFSGSDLPSEDKGLSGKFCVVLSSEAFNQFTFDPWLLNNKNCQLDIINGRFTGSLFGRVTTIIENKPMRFKADGTLSSPELVELNPDAYNYGETIPNPDYFNIETSPYELAFFVGAEGYDHLEVGPPPSEFASNGMPEGFGKMQWNGEVILTKNILVPCVDDAGNVTWETNAYGEYLKFISHATFGILGKQRRNIVPILFKRKRGQ